MEHWLIYALSFVAAFVFALGGVGAAIIMIPIMVSLGIPMNVAKPVGLFYNTVSLSGATISNIRNKRLDFGLGLPIIITSMLFAAIGAYLSKFLPVKVILILFILFLLFSGTMFLTSRSKPEEQYREDRPWLALSLIGAFAGLLSGLLGIGGGGIISPLMLYLGFNPKKITTITAFVVPFSAFSGFLTYWSMGYVDWILLIGVSVCGLAGATLGNYVLHRYLDAKIVKKILAVILLLMAVKLILKII